MLRATTLPPNVTCRLVTYPNAVNTLFRLESKFNAHLTTLREKASSQARMLSSLKMSLSHFRGYKCDFDEIRDVRNPEKAYSEP